MGVLAGTETEGWRRVHGVNRERPGRGPGRRRGCESGLRGRPSGRYYDVGPGVEMLHYLRQGRAATFLKHACDPDALRL